MANQNQCNFTGRMGQDITPAYTNTGSCVVNFSLAVSESYKDSAGNWQEKTVWVNCRCFAQRAEYIAKKASKGMLIRVSGKYCVDVWTDKTSGLKRDSHYFIVNEFEPLTTPTKQDKPPVRHQPQPQDFYTPNEAIPPHTGDDIPF